MQCVRAQIPFFEAHEISCELEQVNLVGIINPSSSSMAFWCAIISPRFVCL